MELEWLATGQASGETYPFEVSRQDEALADQPAVIDTRPMIRQIAAEVSANVPASSIARRFHATLVEIIAATCGEIRRQCGLSRVVFSGGVFMNAILCVEAERRLTSEGFLVYRHQTVPSNDGGLSLGQVAIAAGQLNSP
jgi:hydrogenase maturation protein HypF